MGALRIQLCFAAAYAVAALVGRATVPDGGQVSLVWPAAGVGVLWLAWAAVRPRSDLAVALALHAVVAGAVLAATGASGALAPALAAANVVQSLAGALVLGPVARVPGPDDGPPPLETARGTVRLVTGSVAATLLGAAGGTLALALADGTGISAGSAFALWWGRNLAGTTAVVAVVVLVATPLRARRPLRPPDLTTARLLELAAVVAVTAAAFAVVFREGGPSAFYPLLAVTVWVGLRFSGPVVAAFVAAFGAAAIMLTLAGTGPFAALDDPTAQAVDVQLFVAVSAAVGLVLAASLSDQRRSLARSAEAEAEARSRADLYRAVADEITDGVVVMDLEGGVVARNAAAAVMLDEHGITSNRRAVVHRPDGTRMPVEELPSSKAIRDGSAVAEDLVLVREGRSPTVLSTAAARLDDLRPFAAGPGVVAVYRDVTADRAQRDELAGFAGMVAHDLRSPLTAARGWVELVQLGLGRATREDLVSWLDHAHEATDRMGTLIEDLLAHAGSTGQALELVDVDLAALVRDVVAVQGADDAVVVLDLPPVRADAGLVRQLMVNLVGNALKYADPAVAPHVVVDAVPPDDDGSSEVVVRVTDNGLGIAPEDREAVFSRFYRAHREHADIHGHGLGLALCRTVVERHGGRIRVEDAPGGRGSRFVLTLPGADPAPLPASRAGRAAS